MERLRLNHVRLSVAELEPVLERLEEIAGIGATWVMDRVGGGVTQWVAPIGVHSLEIFATLPGQAVPDRIAALRESGAVFSGWGARTDDINAVCERLGLTPSDEWKWTDASGAVWRLRFAGLEKMWENHALPYFLEYAERPDPTLPDDPDAPAGISWLELGGEPAEVHRWLAVSTGTAELPIRFVDRPAGVWAIGIATRAGNEVRLGVDDLL